MLARRRGPRGHGALASSGQVCEWGLGLGAPGRQRGRGPRRQSHRRRVTGSHVLARAVASLPLASPASDKGPRKPSRVEGACKGRQQNGVLSGTSTLRQRGARTPESRGGPHSSRPSISCIIVEKQCKNPEPQTVATEGPRRPGGGRGAERPPLALTSIHSTALRRGQCLVEPLAEPPHRVPRGPTHGCGGSVARGQAQGRSAPARAGRAERGFSSRPAGGEGGGCTVPGCRFALCSSLCHRNINTY